MLCNITMPPRVKKPMRRKLRVYRRQALVKRMRTIYNPQPTFTETYFSKTITCNQGGIFNVRISDLPQVADYSNLYQQYRINWVKVMLVPDFGASDPNTYAQNFVGGVPAVSNARIAWAINDTPNLVAPVSEADVLTDNGAKVKSLVTKWQASFKARADMFTGDAAGGPGVAVRQKQRSFLSFAEGAANPLHNGISYWISALAAGGGDQAYKVYFKVNFTLRDPK